LVDIDGMAQSPDDFHDKYGWAPRGEDAIRMEIEIANRFFAVHAAYTQRGFLAWEIFEGTVGQLEVAHFLEYRLMPVLNEHSLAILDNARNQKTVAVRDLLEAIFEGSYSYSSPYSPELMPIESGFSLVRSYIHPLETNFIGNLNSAIDPVNLIDEAFQNFSVNSVGGEQGNYFSLIQQLLFIFFSSLQSLADLSGQSRAISGSFQRSYFNKTIICVRRGKN
jgi:hypothetical protein